MAILNLNHPNKVIKLILSTSMIWDPSLSELASNLLKCFAPPSSANDVSTEGKMWHSGHTLVRI